MEGQRSCGSMVACGLPQLPITPPAATPTHPHGDDCILVHCLVLVDSGTHQRLRVRGEVLQSSSGACRAWASSTAAPAAAQACTEQALPNCNAPRPALRRPAPPAPPTRWRAAWRATARWPGPPAGRWGRGRRRRGGGGQAVQCRLGDALPPAPAQPCTWRHHFAFPPIPTWNSILSSTCRLASQYTGNCGGGRAGEGVRRRRGGHWGRQAWGPKGRARRSGPSQPACSSPVRSTLSTAAVPTCDRMYCSRTIRGADTRSSNSPPWSFSSSVLASPVG